MTYKTREKSFFETAIEKPVQGTKDEFAQLEKKGAKKVLKLYDFGESSFRKELKKHPAQYFFLFITTFLGSVITSGIALFGFSGNLLTVFVHPQPTHPATVQVASASSNIVPTQKYDPLLLASKLKSNDTSINIVDVRSKTDFDRGHIKNAVNVPIYNTAMVNKNGDLDATAIRKAFAGILSKDKLLIIYAQSAYSTIPSDIAMLLNSEKMTVKELAVGWDEWLHLSR